jgi:hypothetical protein
MERHTKRDSGVHDWMLGATTICLRQTIKGGPLKILVLEMNLVPKVKASDAVTRPQSQNVVGGQRNMQP